jgi:hypothetical protein
VKDDSAWGNRFHVDKSKNTQNGSVEACINLVTSQNALTVIPAGEKMGGKILLYRGLPSLCHAPNRCRTSENHVIAVEGRSCIGRRQFHPLNEK